MGNPFEPIPKYRLLLFNTETQEVKSSFYGINFMTAKEADAIMKETGESMMPWIYVKKPV